MRLHSPASGLVAAIRRRSPHAGERGSALIEFTFVMPLLLILSLGVVEFGHLIQSRLILTNICREGGSIGSRQQVLDDNLAALLASSGRPLVLDGADGRVVVTRLKAGTSAALPDPVVDAVVSTGSLSVASHYGDEYPNLGLTEALYQRLVFDVDQAAPDISEITVVEVTSRHRTLTPLPKVLEDLVLPDDGGLVLSSKSVF